jgi:hypothetical protein
VAAAQQVVQAELTLETVEATGEQAEQELALAAEVAEQVVIQAPEVLAHSITILELLAQQAAAAEVAVGHIPVPISPLAAVAVLDC